jgi:diguanylate cyclase (GGDEF)-like protein
MMGTKMSTPMHLMIERKIYRGFLISMTLGVALCISGIFLGIAITSRNLIHDEMVSRARAHFEGIVMTRKWNTGYGGVYVEKKPGVESNPYLKNPDIQTTDGRTFTKKNPALMTREISRLFESGGRFSFHITSLNPLNPGNAPDVFEKEALSRFERGEADTFRIESGIFRYMAPLRVEEGCLQCHAEQGYRLGDIRGGISVSFGVKDVEGRLRINLLLIIAASVATTSLLLGFIWFLIARLRKGLSEIRQEIERIAITDALTGIFNRRHIRSRFEEEFSRAKRQAGVLCCIMLDIDHFKSINDTYGHPAGDEVLKELSSCIRDSIRSYDVFGRYGGEEFLLVSPGSNLEETRVIAERLRATVEENVTAKSEVTVPRNVTVSLGVVCIDERDQTIDDMLKRVDALLYKAKAKGRNRVEWEP